MVPYLTSVFMQFGYAMTGVMTLEIVFSWQGMGKLMSNAASAKDYPMLQLSFIILCVCVMFFNLMGNVVAAILDPRIRDGGGA
jgi:peptide/nickel transport system permease protein